MSCPPTSLCAEKKKELENVSPHFRISSSPTNRHLVITVPHLHVPHCEVDIFVLNNREAQVEVGTQSIGLARRPGGRLEIFQFEKEAFMASGALFAQHTWTFSVCESK